MRLVNSHGLNPAGDLSVSLWIKTAALNDSGQGFIYQGTDWDTKTGFGIIDDGPFASQVYSRVNGGVAPCDDAISRSLVNDGVWHHLAGTREGILDKL